MATWKQKYNKKYGFKKAEAHSLSDISKTTGVSKKGLQQIYNKGIGAYKTNPQSVRPNVTSKEQWAMARVYSAVMGGKASKVDAKELKMQMGGSTDIFNKTDFYKGYYQRLSPSNFNVMQKGGKIQIDVPMATNHDGIDEVDAIANGMFAKGGDIGDKIRLLKSEGYPQKQAVAIALDMKDRGKFEKGGETDFNPDGKIKDKIVHASGEAGGMLVGKRHSKGGIKAINKSTGQPLEMEGGEVVITRDAVSDNKKRSFNGKMMTNRQILSAINESGGGVSFADGGELPADVCFDCNAEYEYGGQTMCGEDLVMAMGGVTTAIVTDPNEAMADLQSTYGFGDVYAKGGEIKKYIIVRGTKESEKYYYQKGSNENNYKWLSSKKGATIFTDIKEAEKSADESDGDIVSLTTYAKGGDLEDVFKGVFEEGGDIIEKPKEDATIIFLNSKITELRNKFNIKKSITSNLQKGLMLREIRKYETLLSNHKAKKREKGSFFKDFNEGIKLRFGNIDAERVPQSNNTSLTKNENSLVRSESFIDWFGDWELAKETDNYTGVSKVIDDKTKEPLVVYHGTDTLFTSWETYTSNNLHYFSKKRKFAEFFATSWKDRADKTAKDSAIIKNKNPFKGTYIYPCFLDIKNPIDFSVFGVEKKPIRTYIDYLKIKYDITNFDWIGTNNTTYTDFKTPVYAWMIIRMWQSFNLFIKNNTPFDGFIFYEYIPDSDRNGLKDASLCYTTFNSVQNKFANAKSFNKNIDSRFHYGGKV
jgi:hypothetical protein